MAKIIEKQFNIDIGSMVSEAIDNFTKIRRNIYAKQEGDFLNEVSKNGMSWDQQKAWYENFVGYLTDEPYMDADYLMEVKDRLANVHKSLRYYNYNQKVKEWDTEYNQKLITIGDYIQRLSQEQSSAIDPSLNESITTALDSLKKQKFDMEEAAYQNRIIWENKLGDTTTITRNLTDLQNKRARMVATNTDKDRINLYDSLIAQSQNELVTRKINATSLSLSNIIHTAQSPTDILTAYNNIINASDTGIPVTINNITYNNEQEYWNTLKNRYVQDDSTNGLLASINSMYTGKLEALDDIGLISASDFQSVSSELDKLATSPEYQAIVPQLQNLKKDILTTWGSKAADEILSKFNVDYDFNKASSALDKLTTLGIDISTYKNTLIQNQNTLITARVQERAQTENITTPEAAAKAVAEEAKRPVSEIPTPENVVAGKIPVPAKKATKSTVSVPSTKNEPIVQPEPTEKVVEGTLQINSKTGQIEIYKAGAWTPYTATTTLPIINQPVNKSYIYNQRSYAYGTGPLANQYPTTSGYPITKSSETVGTITPPKSSYTGNSIVDYLKSIGQSSNYTSRAKLAQQYGITNYTGTASQNTQLLKLLRG